MALVQNVLTQFQSHVEVRQDNKNQWDNEIRVLSPIIFFGHWP